MRLKFAGPIGIAVQGTPNHCRWTLKPEFGEVPQYLVKNKQQIAEEKARVEEHLRLRQQQVRLCHEQHAYAVSWAFGVDYMSHSVNAVRVMTISVSGLFMSVLHCKLLCKSAVYRISCAALW